MHFQAKVETNFCMDKNFTRLEVNAFKYGSDFEIKAEDNIGGSITVQLASCLTGLD
jgi:hypothetical protein